MNVTSTLLKNVFGKAVWDQRRALAGWTIALAAYVLLIVSIWPTMAGVQEDLQKLIEGYPPALKAAFGIEDTMFTPGGFLEAELFSAMLPILFLVYAIGRGADVVAGEEERGSLDLLLVHPVTRQGALLQKAAALAVAIAWLGLVVLLALAVGNAALGVDLPFVNLLAATLMLVLFALGFGFLALAIGCVRGRKGLAVGLAATVAAAAYLVHVLANLVESLEPLRWLSPFAHMAKTHPILDGLPLASALVLLAIPFVLLGIALWAFERRDVGV